MRYRDRHSFTCTEDYPVVSTKNGKLRGFEDDGICCFRGIAYAHARRFHEPEDLMDWDGVRDALDYQRICPDMHADLVGYMPEDQLLFPRRLWSMSEDCQNLNIWTPGINDSGKRPVMVWLHGGGYFAGSALDLCAYDGWEFAHRQDIVVVTVNHRLNMLGFMDLSEYSAKYVHSGILGILDLVAALKWIRDNIAAFGGDPENVTIIGQSGGGGKVATLMQMPAADGLYHQAIIQSGVIERSVDLTTARKLAGQIVSKLGLTPSRIEEIETVEYQRLAKTAFEAADELGIDGTMIWGPVPCGAAYRGTPLETGFRPETADIPMIVGTVLSEFGHVPTGSKAKLTDEERLAQVRRVYGNKAESIVEAFRAAYPELDVSYAAAVDTVMRQPSLKLLRLRAACSAAPVFNYIFAFESTLKGGMLVQHSADIHFVFHNAFYAKAMVKASVTERLQDEMSDAVAAFMRTGDPNKAGLPVWPAFTVEQEACMVFGDKTRAVCAHDASLYQQIDANT